MPFVRIFATSDSSTKQKLIVVGCQGEDKKMDFSMAQMFGYCVDWRQEENNYITYPFILESDSNTDTDAVVIWGWGTKNSIIDIRGRRIVEGEKILRYDHDQKFTYTVAKISLIHF